MCSCKLLFESEDPFFLMVWKHSRNENRSVLSTTYGLEYLQLSIVTSTGQGI